MSGSSDCSICAHHQKLAMRKVDDAHHPKDNGKAKRDKHKARNAG
jgi:hypothetical protein